VNNLPVPSYDSFGFNTPMFVLGFATDVNGMRASINCFPI